jgi:hypothetical protein
MEHMVDRARNRFLRSDFLSNFEVEVRRVHNNNRRNNTDLL